MVAFDVQQKTNCIDSRNTHWLWHGAKTSSIRSLRPRDRRQRLFFHSRCYSGFDKELPVASCTPS
jgi:hypothetical protein